MKFESFHVKGKNRGKAIGFPTINLKIPDNFELEEGAYAVKVTIRNKIFIGALHYGPIPTFGEEEKSLEVYLIGLANYELTLNQNKFGSGQADYGLENLDNKIIRIEIIKYLREIKKFKKIEELVRQIEQDVNKIKELT